MISLDSFTLTFLGIFVCIATLMLQQLIAAKSKASQDGAIPGKIDDTLSHSSFVFRAHRTFLNSLENVPAMIATSFLAIFVGANATWMAILIWVFAIARIIHMVLYYKISTEQNPSPRSYFFLIGFVANITLLVFCGVAIA
ncbi:MAG: MAPEG family protein [Pseudomonadales bacterium]|nr:MAPEG family protein [Pseudomonadales bacterium]